VKKVPSYSRVALAGGAIKTCSERASFGKMGPPPVSKRKTPLDLPLVKGASRPGGITLRKKEETKT